MSVKISREARYISDKNSDNVAIRDRIFIEALGL